MAIKQYYLHIKVTSKIKRKAEKLAKDQRRSVSEVIRIMVESA